MQKPSSPEVGPERSVDGSVISHTTCVSEGSGTLSFEEMVHGFDNNNDFNELMMSVDIMREDMAPWTKQSVPLQVPCITRSQIIRDPLIRLPSCGLGQCRTPCYHHIGIPPTIMPRPDEGD